jgi:hypothetical protein
MWTVYQSLIKQGNPEQMAKYVVASQISTERYKPVIDTITLFRNKRFALDEIT